MTGSLLQEHYPDALLEAECIDYDELAAEIGQTRSFYELPTTPDGRDEPWLDKLELNQAVARYVRDGGSIDFERVIVR
jgi:hypothetical protein